MDEVRKHTTCKMPRDDGMQQYSVTRPVHHGHMTRVVVHHTARQRAHAHMTYNVTRVVEKVVCNKQGAVMSRESTGLYQGRGWRPPRRARGWTAQQFGDGQ